MVYYQQWFSQSKSGTVRVFILTNAGYKSQSLRKHGFKKYSFCPHFVWLKDCLSCAQCKTFCRLAALLISSIYMCKALCVLSTDASLHTVSSVLLDEEMKTDNQTLQQSGWLHSLKKCLQNETTIQCSPTACHQLSSRSTRQAANQISVLTSCLISCDQWLKASSNERKPRVLILRRRRLWKLKSPCHLCLLSKVIPCP